ncbi:NF038143 family protein [Thermodesulfobacteriota bacterium]
MNRKVGTILAAEEYFARRVALRVAATRPLKMWQQIIPGMFIFDFLTRQKGIRVFSGYYMFPRKLAMERARKSDEAAPEFEDTITAWLTDQNLYSQDIHSEMIRLVDLLSEHYSRLLRADGDIYEDVVSKAYNTREDYDAFLTRLTEMEHRIDAFALARMRNPEANSQELRLQQEQIEALRKKDANAIFLLVLGAPPTGD